jgi:hypothetical protein
MNTAKRIAAKSILSAVLWIAYFAVQRIFCPVMTNEQALNQLNDTKESFVNLQVYQVFWNYAWLIPLIILILIFREEITDLYYKIKGVF